METNSQCCPDFEVQRWDGREFKWSNKRFIRETIPTFFHIPFPPVIAAKVTKMMKLTESANAETPDIKDALLLFGDPSPFKSEILLSVEKEVAGAQNVELSGTFLCTVFDGPFREIPKYINEIDLKLARMNLKAMNYYVHYAYCPKCAQKFGHNYMAFFAQV